MTSRTALFGHSLRAMHPVRKMGPSGSSGSCTTEPCVAAQSGSQFLLCTEPRSVAGAWAAAIREGSSDPCVPAAPLWPGQEGAVEFLAASRQVNRRVPEGRHWPCPAGGDATSRGLRHSHATTPRPRLPSAAIRARGEGALWSLQVTDGFHLLQNLSQAVEKCIAAHRDDLHGPDLPVTRGGGERRRARRQSRTGPAADRAACEASTYSPRHGARTVERGHEPASRSTPPGLGPAHRPEVRPRGPLAGHRYRPPHPDQPSRRPPVLPATTHRRDRQKDLHQGTTQGTRRAWPTSPVHHLA